MKRIDYTALIRESVPDLETLEREQSQSRFRDYVRFIRYLKTGEASSQVRSGAKIGLKPRQSQNLWQRYLSHQGLAALLIEKRGGAVGYLSYHQISLLQSFLRNRTTPLNQEQIIIWFKDSFGVVFTQGALSSFLKRLKVNGDARAAQDRASCQCASKRRRCRRF